jgi:hypothetical protein
VTTPGVVAVINGVLAGVLSATVAPRLGVDSSVTLGLAVAVGLVTVALHAVYQYRGAVMPQARRQARFPGDSEVTPESDPR